MIVLPDYISSCSEDHCNIETFDIASVKSQLTDFTNRLSIYDDKTVQPPLSQVMSSFSDFPEFLHRLIQQIYRFDNSGNLMYLLFNDDWSPKLLALATEVESRETISGNFNITRLTRSALNTLKNEFCIFLVAFSRKNIIHPVWQRKLDAANRVEPKKFFEQLTKFVTEHSDEIQIEQTVLNLSAHIRETRKGVKGNLNRNNQAYTKIVDSTKLLAYLMCHQAKQDPEYVDDMAVNMDTPIQYLKGRQLKNKSFTFDLFEVSPDFKNRYKEYISDIEKFEDFFTNKLSLNSNLNKHPIVEFAIDQVEALPQSNEQEMAQSFLKLKELYLFTNEFWSILHYASSRAHELSQRELGLYYRGILLSGVNNVSVVSKLFNNKPYMKELRSDLIDMGEIGQLEREPNYPTAQIISPYTYHYKTIFRYGSRDSNFMQVKAKLCNDYPEYNEAVKKVGKKSVKPNNNNNKSNNEANSTNNKNRNNSNSQGTTNTNNNNNYFNRNNNSNYRSQNRVANSLVPFVHNFTPEDVGDLSALLDQLCMSTPDDD